MSLIENSGRWLGNDVDGRLCTRFTVITPVAPASVGRWLLPSSPAKPPDRVNHEAMPAGAGSRSPKWFARSRKPATTSPRRAFHGTRACFPYRSFSRLARNGRWSASGDGVSRTGGGHPSFPQGTARWKCSLVRRGPRSMGWGMTLVGLLLLGLGDGLSAALSPAEPPDREFLRGRAFIHASYLSSPRPGAHVLHAVLLQPLGLFHRDSPGPGTRLSATEQNRQQAIRSRYWATMGQLG